MGSEQVFAVGFNALYQLSYGRTNPADGARTRDTLAKEITHNIRLAPEPTNVTARFLQTAQAPDVL